MEKIFSWCTSLTEKLESSNYVEYFHDYFVETAICAKVLGVGLLIALLVALIYYWFVCNRFFALAKRGVWIVILLLTFVASIFISYQMIMGNDSGDSDNSTGIYLASYLTEEELVSNTNGNTDAIVAINTTAGNYRNELSSGIETLPIEIAIVNAFYTIIFYLLFSLVLKKHTTHGKAIPW